MALKPISLNQTMKKKSKNFVKSSASNNSYNL